MQWLILALGRVMPVAVISVAATTATVSSFGCAPSAVTTGTFTMTHPSGGVIEITWPANTFPTAVSKPMAALNNGPGMIYAEAITNGVRVHTADSSGSAVDLDFTVTIY
jgi:hypothetical protein